MLSGRGFCDEPITHPEESYRLWCVAVCDLETSRMRRPWSAGSSCAENKQTYIYIYIYCSLLSYYLLYDILYLFISSKATSIKLLLFEKQVMKFKV